jgi:hypothetical protein
MSDRPSTSSAGEPPKWTGFDKKKPPPDWEGAMDKYSKPGGTAEAVRYFAPFYSFKQKILVMPKIDIFVATYK